MNATLRKLEPTHEFHDLATAIGKPTEEPQHEDIDTIVARDLDKLVSAHDGLLEHALRLYEQVTAILEKASESKRMMLQSRDLFCKKESEHEKEKAPNE